MLGEMDHLSTLLPLLFIVYLSVDGNVCAKAMPMEADGQCMVSSFLSHFICSGSISSPNLKFIIA